MQLLRQLPQLSSASLGVRSCYDTELDDSYPWIEPWNHHVKLPPLANVPALTELHLAGQVQLPPDFRQLSQLQRLSATGLHGFDEDGHLTPFDWGSAPLTGLTSLSHVELCQGHPGMVLPGGQPKSRRRRHRQPMHPVAPTCRVMCSNHAEA